eukprot:scaffold7142_cov44-Attheya_sp.AAC.1
MGIRGRLLIRYPKKVVPPTTTETSDPARRGCVAQSEWTDITLKKVPVKKIEATDELKVNDAFYCMRIGRYGMSQYTEYCDIG